MAKEKGKAGTSGRGRQPKNSTQPSALITNPENKPVLVAKLRDDLNVLIKADFLVAIEEKSLNTGDGRYIQSVTITIATKPPGSLGFSSGSFCLDGKIVE